MARDDRVPPVQYVSRVRHRRTLFANGRPESGARRRYARRAPAPRARRRLDRRFRALRARPPALEGDRPRHGRPAGDERDAATSSPSSTARRTTSVSCETSSRGHELRGTGDTPVLPHLYEQRGAAVRGATQGMFALALWDGPRERLVLARDRLGKKPLLWTRLPDGTLAFASELKALLAFPGLAGGRHGGARCVSRAGVRARRRGRHCAAIHKLPPGHVLVAEGRRRTDRALLAGRAGGASAGEQEWLERVRRTVDEAVRKRLVADVPLGALLSGGIDSSIVVALMAQASSEPVRTFTVGFADARYDERAYARLVATRYGTCTKNWRSRRTSRRRCRDWQRRTTSRSATRLRSRPSWSPSRRAGMSRSRLRATAVTNLRGLRALCGARTGRAHSVAGREGGRIGATGFAGSAAGASLAALPCRALSRRGRDAGAGALRAADGGLPTGGRDRRFGPIPAWHVRPSSRRPVRASPGCSSSTSRRISPAISCSRRISPRWRTRSSCARRFSTRGRLPRPRSARLAEGARS